MQAVVFSGGEATLQAALGDAMRTVRELGFRVGLHSAGINPRAFARVLGQSDWVGFDVKAPAEDVAAITGVDGSGAANWRSLEYLLDSGVAYECRTTVHWGLFDSERLWRLATRLRGMGVERFAVQLARPARQLDPQLLAKPAPQGAAQLWRELEEPVSRLRTARRLSLRFSGAARACQARSDRAGSPDQACPSQDSYDRTRAPSRFLVASNCRGRRRSPPLLQIQRPRTRAMKLTLTPP